MVQTPRCSAPIILGGISAPEVYSPITIHKRVEYLTSNPAPCNILCRYVKPSEYHNSFLEKDNSDAAANYDTQSVGKGVDSSVSHLTNYLQMAPIPQVPQDRSKYHSDMLTHPYAVFCGFLLGFLLATMMTVSTSSGGGTCLCCLARFGSFTLQVGDCILEGLIRVQTKVIMRIKGDCRHCYY